MQQTKEYTGSQQNMKKGLKNLKVSIEIKNSEKLNTLLQKAEDQLEQLNKTLNEVRQLELEISLN